MQPRDQARHQDQGGEGVRAGAGRELQVRESSFQTFFCIVADVVSPRTELSTVYSEETRQDCTQVPAIVCQNVTSQQCGAKQKPVQETVTNTECRTESVEVGVWSLLRTSKNLIIFLIEM